jgi:hypothetical protein
MSLSSGLSLMIILRAESWVMINHTHSTIPISSQDLFHRLSQAKEMIVTQWHATATLTPNPLTLVRFHRLKDNATLTVKDEQNSLSIQRFHLLIKW